MYFSAYLQGVGRKRRTSSAAYRGGLIAIVPTVVAIALLLLLPAVYALYLGISGVRGFRTLLIDKHFTQSLVTTFHYSIVTVVIQTVFGTLAAAAVHRSRFGAFIALLLFLPYAIPSVVAVVAWKFLILDHGILPRVLYSVFGLNKEAWMGDGIFWTLIVISVWQFYPFVFLSLLARMRRIPSVLYRNAQLDGASPIRQFVHITLPSIKSTLVTVVILRFAFMFTKFDTPWLLVGGTANDRVETLPIYIYRNMGLDVRVSPGISAAIVMALILGLMILVFFTVRRILKAEEF